MNGKNVWPSAPLPSVLRPLEIGTQKAPDWSTELRVGERPVGKKKEGLNKQRELEQHFPTVAMETGVTVPHACRLHTPPTKRMLQNWSLRLMDVCVCVRAPWTGCQPIAHTFNTTDNFEMPISVQCTSLQIWGRGKPGYLEETPQRTCRPCARTAGAGSEPSTLEVQGKCANH